MANGIDSSRRPSAGKGPVTIGKYRVLSLLGEGGMGFVYRARDPEVGRDVAIKVLKPSSDSDLSVTELESRFKLEARSLGSLKHPNIISVFEASYQTSEPYIVMEFIEGETLNDKIKRSGRLPPHAALGYLGQVASGLDYAHSRGVIHQDIKSSNIMIDRHGHVYILDFGIAEMTQKYGRDGAAAAQGLILGTPAALAPEQISKRGVDHRTDLYALGVVAFETLSGSLPYNGSSAQEVIENIRQARRYRILDVLPEAPPQLEDFFDKALALLREDRFNSAHELISELAKAFGIEPSSVASLVGEQITLNRNQVKPKLVPLHSVTSESIQTPPPGDSSNPWRLVAGESKFVPITTRPTKYRKHEDISDWSDDRRKGRAISPGFNPEALIRMGGILVLIVVMPILFYNQLNKKKGRSAPPPTAQTVIPPSSSDSLDIPSENPLVDLGLNDIEIGEPDRSIPVDERSDADLLATLVSDASSEPEVLAALELAEAKRISQLASAAADLLQYPSHTVRVGAADLLGRLQDRRALPYLMISLEDVDTVVRIASAKAIGTLGEKKALGFLTMKYKTETVPEVRLAMKRAIEELNGFPMPE